MGERRGMKALELWCKKVTDGYPGVKVENMTTSWRDGLAFCALIHHFRPDLIDFPSLEKGDVYRNNELAFRTAERHLGIPALLDAEDMALYEVPDRLSILTYLSQFYQVFASQGNSPVKRSPEPAERSLVLGSSVPTPPPKERSCAIRRKEPCRKCGLPVFLAQRLVVDGHLHHRTCFRCARCDTQLTLANYYETMDGVYCCETCPDEEPNDSNSGSVIGGDKDDVNVAKDICSDNSVTLDNDNQLTTAIEKTEELVSSRNKSLVGIRKMMFENIAHKKDVSELTDDDKVVIKTKKGSRDDKFSSDNGDKNVNKSFIKSDKINSSSSVDCSVELMVNKISDFNLDTGDSNVKSIIVNNEQVTNKLSDAINDKNNKISDLPFIDSEHEYRSDSVNIVENIIKENDNEALDKNIQGVVCEQNESNLEESHDFVEPICNLPKDVNIPNELVKEDLKQLCDQDTYLDMKSLLNDDTTVEVSEPIYEEISEVKSYSNVPVTILVQEDVEEKMNDSVDISVSVEHPNVTESIKNDMEDGIEKLDYEVEDQNVVVNLEDTAEKEKEDKTIVEDQTKPAIILSVENNENVDEVITEKAEQSDSIDYPSQLNPFGDDEDDTEDMNNQTISTNPFESDMEDEEEEKSINEKATLVPVPAARANKSSYSENLNPFWSGSEEEEDEKSSLLSPPVPLPRKLKTPQMSPTPIMRSSRHRKTSSVGSGSNFVTAESQSPLKKKSPAPVPPSQNSTLKKRKAKPPPPPPPLPLSSRSPTPSVSSDLSTPVTPIMGEKVKKNSSNQENQFSDNTLPRNKSTFGQWKRKKGQAPPPPLPQRRTVKPMPLKQVRQELADIEIKQQELERQGVTLEQTIRDKFDQESSMTPYVEELVLQLFELVNEKNELFRRQAELMYLRRQHNLEEEHAELEYQIRCLMLCPEHNKTDYDKEREEELIKRLVDVVERRNSVVQCLEMDRLREAEEDRSVNAQLGSFSAAAIGSEIDLTNCDKKDKKHKKDKKKEIDVCSTLGRDTEAGEKMHKYKKLKKKWFTLQHQKKS